MEFDQTLSTRRSIRAYKPEPVSQADLEAVLNAALMAPSWKNSQNRRYYVVQNPENLAALKNDMIGEVNTFKVKDAPVLIVSTFEKGLSGIGKDDWANELAEGWGLYDLGLADENLVLKARDLGLGTLIMGIRDADKIRKLLNIPENRVIVSVIALGHPDVDPAAPKRKTIEEIVTFC